jgi:hypothetical protein
VPLLRQGLPQADSLADSTLRRFQEGIPAEAPPLPGGVSTVLRQVFNAPAWAWLLAIVVGLGIAIWLGRRLWTRRRALHGWLVTRDRGVKLGLGVGLVAVLGLVGFTGVTSWNYMQHDNNFCVSCHVMEGPWNKFAFDAGKHSDLQCHDCHQQTMYASTRQLVLWVANKPEEIPEHAPVPNQRCESCHSTGEDSTWQRVATTAGHRTHLESDSTALKDVQCVTCHGEEVHAFLPASRTCGQSGCHENLEITLGGMAQQTTLHCNTCHQFTAEVPRLATRDSAAGTLRPTLTQCLACHQMRERLADFDPDRDPHGGACGACHDPHTQDTPEAAGQTCTTAGCHADWRNTPFHVGTNHGDVGESCLTCHQPHAARVDASDCVACHTAVREQGARRVMPPLPFDTTQALRPVSLDVRHGEEPARGKGDAPPPELRPPIGMIGLEPPPDTFPHARHTSLACITCHAAPADQGGRLAFAQPRGCDICHHQAPTRNDCARCHQPAELTASHDMAVSVTVPDQAARVRPVAFAHPTHDALTCVTCHLSPVTLAPPESVRQCADCHGEHHARGRTCATCHHTDQLTTAHQDDVRASHQRCDACHTASTVAMLTPDRSFCLTCHQPQDSDHYPRRECTTCHFLQSPEGFRPHLTGGARR